MKVLFLTNVPSPYRVDFFSELGKYCDLTVIFEKNTSDERDKSWSEYLFTNFRGIILVGKSIKTDSAICIDIVRYVKDRTYDCIICSNFSTLTGMIAILSMKKNRIPYYLEADGGFAKNGKGVKEHIKRQVISGAKGYFSSSVSCDHYFYQYGAAKDKIYRYPFTSLYKSEIIEKPVSAIEKKKLRQILGIKEEKVVLSAGQFIYRKGFDLLIRAAASVNEEVGIYIVGGIETKEYRQLRQNVGAKNVHFIGFRSKNELAELYKAADIFVHPTREDIWGLVINEAMAYGLPIITTKKCGAGLELVDEKNGMIISIDSVEELSEGIKTIINSDDMLKQMAQKSLEKIKGYTIENMAKKHIEILKRDI